MVIRPLCFLEWWPVELNWTETYTYNGQVHETVVRRGFRSAHDALKAAIYYGLTEFRIEGGKNGTTDVGELL